MFKIVPDPTFWSRVPLTVPGHDAAEVLEVEFRHKARSAIQSFFEGLEGKSDADALSEIVVGWKNASADYSRESLEALLDNHPLAASELFAAWRRELFEARAKN